MYTGDKMLVMNMHVYWW